jgi:hypothetical protein
VRRNADGNIGTLHLSKQLFQQWLVSSWLCVERNNLRYYRNNQVAIRAEYYQGIADASGDDTTRRGRRIVLPHTFSGCPRNMKRRYMNAQAVARETAPPTHFVTVTCNPNDPAMKAALEPGQHATDRPDIVARVFKMRLAAVLKDIFEEGVFGAVSNWFWVIEWQKRGLPHCHILFAGTCACLTFLTVSTRDGRDCEHVQPLAAA